MFSRVHLCLGTALPAAVLGAPAGAATVDLQFDTLRPHGATPAPRRAMSDFLATHTVSEPAARDLRRLRRLGRAFRLGQPAEHQGRQLHVVRRGRQRPLGGRRRRQAAGAQRQRHAPGAATTPTTCRSAATGSTATTTSACGGRSAGVGKFNALAFFVLDAADVGGKFSIKVGDTLYSDLAGAGGKLANGNIHFVRILLSEAVDSLTRRADARPHQRRLRHRRRHGRASRRPAAARPR